MSKLDDLAAFVAVAELKSLSKSAKVFEVSRSSMSRRIDRLEQRLGIRLVDRSPQFVGLTEAGEAFYERCKLILRDIEEAESTATMFNAEIRGELRVNCAISYAMIRIIPRIEDFSRAYSHLKLNITLSDDIIDLSQDRHDVYIRMGDIRPQSLTKKRIGWTRQILCAAPSYLERRGRPQSPDDLKHHNCLVLSAFGTGSNNWSFEGPDGAVSVEVSGNLTVNSGEAHYGALLAGMGIGRVMDIRSTVDLAEGRLVPVLEDYWPKAARPIFALYSDRRLVPPKIRAFIDFFSNESAE